jgi:alpha-tubulin suppressor-like RCC1 family protein
VPQGPQRLDYDEKVKIKQNMILDKKLWLPCIPIPVPIDSKIHFKQVSCGKYHTAAVSKQGEVYGCGLKSKGRLGLSQD